MTNCFDRRITMPIVRFIFRHCANKRGYFFMNLGGSLYSILLIVLLLYYGCETCPSLEGDRCVYYEAIGCFITAECILNFLCFHIFVYRNRLDYITPKTFADPGNTATIECGQPLGGDSSTENKSMKFCSICNRTVPTRSHHCSLCQYCVIKNDHHCFALGGCVGFGNQRFFVIFCFWATLGGLYGTWMCARFVHNFIVPFGWWGLFDYFFPLAMVKWIFVQHIDLEQMGYILLITCGWAGGTGALLFFILQCVLIVRGQTMHEMYKRKTPPLMNAPLRIRIEYVFGPFWLLNFFVPLPFRNRMDESLTKFLYECQLKKI